MAEAARTPGPLSFEGPDDFGDFNIHCRHERAVVAAVINNLRPAREVRANAAFLVRAWNCHDDLVNALERAEEWLSGWASAEPYLTEIRTALAAAKNGSAA